MSKKIDTDANINSVRIKEQANKPSTPANGYGQVYGKSNGLYLEDDAGNVGSGLLVTNVQSLTGSGTFSGVAGNAYFFDISGLTGDKNFILPSGEVGDRIYVQVTVGDNLYELIIKGDTGVSVNGGSTATEWSRLLISGESVELVLTTTTNWQIARNGRIPCKGLMTLSAAETTNTAGAETTPTWDNKVIDIGNIGDTTNYRFNIRRAGYYRISGCYFPNTAPADQNYEWLKIKQNTTIVNSLYGLASGANELQLPLSPKDVLCAVDDTLNYVYQTQAANRGMSADDSRSFFQVEEVF